MTETAEQREERLLNCAAGARHLRVRKIVPREGPSFWDVQRGDRDVRGRLTASSIRRFIHRHDALDFYDRARLRRRTRLAATRPSQTTLKDTST